MRFSTLALIVSVVLGASNATADSSLLFETGHLDGVAAGDTLTYAVDVRRYDRETQEVTATEGAISLTSVRVADRDRPDIMATLDRNGRSRELAPFQGVSANPVFLIFLEQVVRDVATETGGSPFYIRNRFKDGLGGGLTSETQGDTTILTMHPLENDPNAAKLGVFAGLEVSFEVDSAVPGMFRSLSASAGSPEEPVFLEEVTYDAKP